MKVYVLYKKEIRNEANDRIRTISSIRKQDIILRDVVHSIITFHGLVSVS